MATSYRIPGALSGAGIVGSRSLTSRNLRKLLAVATFTALGNRCLVVAARRARWPPKNLGVLLADVSLAAGLNLWAARVVPPRSLFDD